MLYSGNLLKKYINVEDDIELLSKHLTLKTCEIEEFHIRKVPEDVVIGKTTKVEKHPEADTLFVCEVNCWKHWVFQIITWWDNIVENKFVATALPGCYLPAIDMKIDSRKMRWVESNWMICSKWELWINEDDDKHWIWLMEEDLQDLTDDDIWLSLGEKYPWMENYILDVDNKTLTNRPDLTWHFGIGVELNWIYRNEKNKIKFNSVRKYMKTFADTKILETLDRSSKSNRKVEWISNDLNTYILIELNNVEVKQSTFYTRTLMLDSKAAPRNNWVDFSNLFMLLSWQPVHFFDADEVDGNIIIRNAYEWETFVDLFDKEHKLIPQDLVIADKSKILALAGIIWWKSSGVTENTKNILIEIANFNPVTVRKTWTRLWLRTDAELRFEKNINPLYSLNCLLLLLDELKYFAKDLWDYDLIWLDYYCSNNVFKSANKSKQISLNPSCICKFILWEENEEFIKESKEILEWIGFKVKENWDVTVPFWRSEDDINNQADIYEEITRIFWYEKIPATQSNAEIKYASLTPNVELTRLIEEKMVFLWYNQVETYPWLDNEWMEFLNVNKEELLWLINPITPESSVLRTAISYWILKMIKKNSKFFDNINIFEIWKIWEKLEDNKFNEKTNVIFCSYIKSSDNWEKDTFLKTKSILETLLNKINVKWKLDYILTKESTGHPKKQWKIMLNGKQLWIIYQLHPIFNEQFKLPEKSQTSLVEISFDIIKEMFIAQKKWIYNSKYETLQDQIIIRDLSFVIWRNEEFGKITQAMKKIKEIESFETFDIYWWDKLSENEKSISISIKIKWTWNMTTETINEIMNKTIQAVQGVGGRLR